jgi:arsenate reductase
MAEGWARQINGESLCVKSAGIEAHGLNPRAISVMAEAGIDITDQQSSVLDETTLEWADYLVTVCGHADERCPVLSPGTRKDHWPLPDPAQAVGTEQEILGAFRETRDDIRARVADLIERLRVASENREAFR